MGSRRSFVIDILKTLAGAWVAATGAAAIGCEACSPATKYGGPPPEPTPEPKYGGPPMMEPTDDAGAPPINP